MKLSELMELFKQRLRKQGFQVSESPKDPAFDAEMHAFLQRVEAMQRVIPDDDGHEHEFTESPHIPIGTWIRLRAPDFPSYVGFTYVDPGAGLSIKGSAQNDPDLARHSKVTYRLPAPMSSWRALSQEEIERLDLPIRPSWLANFGPQPAAGTHWASWREHPQLVGRFHPECPDDLQVVIHDGGPRLSEHPPECVWVRVVGGERSVFQGQVLNAPCHLKSVLQGDLIRFVVPEGSEHALMVTDRYLSERTDWTIHPCRTCGLAELYDAPSDLIRVVFPDVPDGVTTNGFSAICPACGGIQVVQHKSFHPEDPGLAESPESSGNP